MLKSNRIKTEFSYDPNKRFKVEKIEDTNERFKPEEIVGYQESHFFKYISTLYSRRRWWNWILYKENGEVVDLPLHDKDSFQAHLWIVEDHLIHFKSNSVICEFTYV